MATATTTTENFIEAERERLMKAGYSEGEISQILISREAGRSATGSGAATGLLNNLGAVSSHARNLMPGLKADLENIVSPKVAATARGVAAITLSLKVTVIAVLGYVVWLEFCQIRSSTDRARAEACSARMKAIAENIPSSKWAIANAEFAKDCEP
jgi:hypothetical protein